MPRVDVQHGVRMSRYIGAAHISLTSAKHDDPKNHSPNFAESPVNWFLVRMAPLLQSRSPSIAGSCNDRTKPATSLPSNKFQPESKTE